jgi:signal transduction histidine kinase
VIKIVENLRCFSRIDSEGKVQSYDLNIGIESTLDVARNELKYIADVQKDLTELPTIEAIGGEINQVLLNIIINAAQAIESMNRKERGTISIRTYPEGDFVVCEIADDGPGIPEDKIIYIFEPFFTTKDSGKGTGLGLSISNDIILNKHHGELKVQSEVGKGTTFTMKLPLQSGQNNRNSGNFSE